MAVGERVSVRSGRALMRLASGSLVLVLAWIAGMAGAGSAAADLVDPGDDALRVTFVARICGSYDAIRANKARNDLMESLRDLGPDTNYPRTGVVDPALEAAGTPGCAPLTGWRMAMGPYLAAKSPATLNLSTVTSPVLAEVVTEGTVPLLDAAGNPTGSTIDGATTVTLTGEALARARSGGLLTVQGGTPTAPLNGRQGDLAFGSLRCAQDALNGDNVEYVSFPQGQRHVFCYYYAVSPPPDAGTIVVRKELEPGTNGAGTFRFDGNLGFGDSNGDGTQDFTLDAPPGQASERTFIRAEVGPQDEPWRFVEVPRAGWNPPSDPVCTSADGGSAVAVDPVTHEVSITLAGGDTVTCVVTNSRDTTGQMSLAVQTIGGTDAFPVTVEVPPGETGFDGVVQTTQDGVAVEAWSSAGGALGTYTFSQTLPAPSPVGSWELQGVRCGSLDIPVQTTGLTSTFSLYVITPSSNHCVFVNVFRPGGSLTINETSTGGVGTFSFDVVQVDGAGEPVGDVTYRSAATTVAQGVQVAAVADGPATDALVISPSTQYLVRQSMPAGSLLGDWSLVAVDCGPNAVTRVGPDAFVVTLTADLGAGVCDVVNAFSPTGRFQLDVRATPVAALRPGSSLVEARCDEGTTIAVTATAGTAAATSGAYAVLGDVDCSIVPVSAGAAVGTTVTTTATLRVDSGTPGPFDPAAAAVSLAAGRDVLVEVTVTVVGSPVPVPSDPGVTPGGGTPPAQADPGAGSPGQIDATTVRTARLADTGTPVDTLAAAAAALVVLGACLLTSISRPRRG